MISTDTGIAAGLVPLDAALFKCFDPIDDDEPAQINKSVRPQTLFDETGFGSGTSEEPAASKKAKPSTKRKVSAVVTPLDGKTSDERRVEFYTRVYEPSKFDLESRPQWISHLAANDNQKRKHSFPALDEARNNTLMVGRNKADTLTKNEWAFDILIEIKELMDAAAPKCAWLQHSGHGETDEHAIEDNATPGYGVDAKHDYGPSEAKVKRLWEYVKPPKDGTPCNDNEPSKDGTPWKLGSGANPDTKSADGYLVDTIMCSPETGTSRWIRVLSQVGGLEFDQRGRVYFQNKKGKRLEFKTKTRGPKGSSARPDPIDTSSYDNAALPRNKKGELAVSFSAGKIGSSNSAAHDPWAAQLSADEERYEAAIKLAQYRSLVGNKAYDALTQAASGFRIGEVCGGRLGNTTDSSRGRNLLQFAIERIIEERSRTIWQRQSAA